MLIILGVTCYVLMVLAFGLFVYAQIRRGSGWPVRRSPPERPPTSQQALRRPAGRRDLAADPGVPPANLPAPTQPNAPRRVLAPLAD
jgi:hypothetical protein